jgi:putative phosphoesterase
MKLGILSDSHGRVAALREALQLLEGEGAMAFIHCGDVGGLDAIEELAGRRCWFVWGNTDMPEPDWRPYVLEMGLKWPEGPLDLDLSGRRIGVFHGHERSFSQAIDAAEFDYLFYGHTHQKDDHRVKSMRVVNPGALHRAAVKTVALLDLESDDLRFLQVH